MKKLVITSGNGVDAIVDTFLNKEEFEFADAKKYIDVVLNGGNRPNASLIIVAGENVADDIHLIMRAPIKGGIPTIVVGREAYSKAIIEYSKNNDSGIFSINTCKEHPSPNHITVFENGSFNTVDELSTSSAPTSFLKTIYPLIERQLVHPDMKLYSIENTYYHHQVFSGKRTREIQGVFINDRGGYKGLFLIDENLLPTLNYIIINLIKNL